MLLLMGFAHADDCQPIVQIEQTSPTHVYVEVETPETDGKRAIPIMSAVEIANTRVKSCGAAGGALCCELITDREVSCALPEDAQGLVRFIAYRWGFEDSLEETLCLQGTYAYISQQGETSVPTPRTTLWID